MEDISVDRSYGFLGRFALEKGQNARCGTVPSDRNSVEKQRFSAKRQAVWLEMRNGFNGQCSRIWLLLLIPYSWVWP